MPTDPKRPPLNQDFLNLQTMLQIVRAECTVLLALVERLHIANGRTQIEGEPIREWFYNRTFETMIEEVRRIAQHDPELSDGILATIRSISHQDDSSQFNPFAK
jgi:hypothetical protein